MSGRGLILTMALLAAFLIPYVLSINTPSSSPADGNAAAWLMCSTEPQVVPSATASPLPTVVPSWPRETVQPDGTVPDQQGTVDANFAGPQDRPVFPPAEPVPAAFPSSAYPLAGVGPAGTSAASALTSPSGVVEPGGWVTVRTYPANAVPGGSPLASPPAMAPPAAVDESRPAAAPQQSPPANHSLTELTDFGLQPAGIMQRWPRVATQLVDGDLAEMRVPFVSGTQPQDLAGSLSYFFDRQQALQRVAFQGATGDPTQLVRWTVEQCGLKAEPALGGGMYLARDATNPQMVKAALRLRQAPVARQTQPLRKYFVQLELNRPGGDLTLSRAFQSLLDQDVRSGRWIPASQTNDATPPVQMTSQKQASSTVNTMGQPIQPNPRPG